MELFTDRDLGGRQFPTLLRDAGLTVHAHKDHLAPDAPDTEWLPQVDARGWIILSLDFNIRRNPLERDAVFGSGAAFFALTGGSATARELAQNFLNTLPLVERFLAGHPSPFIAKIDRATPPPMITAGRPRRVEMVLTLAEWRELKRQER